MITIPLPFCNDYIGKKFVLQFLEKILEGCGNDLDSAIKSLNELRLSSEDNLAYAASNHTKETNLNLNQGLTNIFSLFTDIFIVSLGCEKLPFPLLAFSPSHIFYVFLC